jgi:phytoene dehydrogenase-like protein
MAKRYDAVIVGAGPNGLAAAITLAQAGLSTRLVEAQPTPGGGMRSQALTLPGFVHDVCSSVHPLAVASPFFRLLGLERHGVSWCHAPVPLAHVLDEERVVLLKRSVEATAQQLSHRDGDAYRRLLGPYVERFDELIPNVLGPLHFPESPLLFARFGMHALRSLHGMTNHRFAEDPARALLGGIAAHAMVELDEPATASFALVLGAAGHAVGWPVARGGSQAIADALAAEYLACGGELVVGEHVQNLCQLPKASAYVLDVTPRQLLYMGGELLPKGYRKRLARYRYGPGVFKMDWALSAPIPWRNPECARACTVHLSGSEPEIAATETAVHHGALSERPFVVLVQPSLFDDTRAPAGQHTAWAYCHVPHGSAVDASAAIEAQIERFAPGFSRIVLARSTMNALELSR